MTFWCLKFSKKKTQKFDRFLPKNLKSGQIIKQRHSIMHFNLKIGHIITCNLECYKKVPLFCWFDQILDSWAEICQFFFFGFLKKHQNYILRLTDVKKIYTTAFFYSLGTNTSLVRSSMGFMYFWRFNWIHRPPFFELPTTFRCPNVALCNWYPARSTTSSCIW